MIPNFEPKYKDAQLISSQARVKTHQFYNQFAVIFPSSNFDFYLISSHFINKFNKLSFLFKPNVTWRQTV